MWGLESGCGTRRCGLGLGGSGLVLGFRSQVQGLVGGGLGWGRLVGDWFMGDWFVGVWFVGLWFMGVWFMGVLVIGIGGEFLGE